MRITNVTGALTVAVCLLLTVAACAPHSSYRRSGVTHSKVYNTSQLDTGVENILRNNYKLNVTSVNCPSNERVVSGNSFYCTAMINGETTQVRVAVQNSSGQYQVTAPQ